MDTVHLPYGPDWLSAWEDRPLDLDEDWARFHAYGRSRRELLENVRRAVDVASELRPAHGVFHACNADTPEIFHRTYTRSDSYVVGELCELANTVASSYAGGEPPVRLMFENLWWPGLRLVDDSGYRIMERRLEFENWGVCLDTGHLMSCLPTSSEEDGIERLLRVFDGYCPALVDSIGAVHLHWSASAEYRATFPERERDGPLTDFIVDANRHVQSIDRHLPFTSPRCAELLDALRPERVVHELPGWVAGPAGDFRSQRSLLDGRPCDP